MLAKILTLALALAVPAACGDGSDGGDARADGDDGPHPEVVVTVTLDGQPVADAVVTQGGTGVSTRTDWAGRAHVTIDPHVGGELVVMASVPSARIGAAEWTTGAEALAIDLVSFAPTDNADYVFQDPGTPTRRDTTSQCAHCHLTLNDDWWASPHRTSASNPAVQALYRGTVAVDGGAAACAARGGTWVPGSIIKGRPEPSRCYLGAGVLPTLNPDACPDGPCDGAPSAFGACADCHAPGIDGALGGRDLAEADGLALEAGVHCDVCHRVDAIDLAAPAGVAGRLRLHRPSEPSPSIALGRFRPLTFGPHHDVANPRMGLVQRDHFHAATLCAGCHELAQPALVPGATVDRARWPDGLLPVHTTFSEWQAGPQSPAAPCQSCHMPPAAEPWNGADLQVFGDAEAGVAAGWMRAPGSVRHHSFVGPRTRASRLLELAASLTIDKTLDDTGRLEVTATVGNVGPGHALPTGEPLRAVLLVVQATCDGAPLDAVDGDVVSDVGGALDRKLAGEDWARWPGAAIGDVVRVVRRPGGAVDYDGVGPFAAAASGGRFTPEQKGLPREVAAGARTIVALDADDGATFDAPLPPGDIAYRARGPAPEAGIVDGAPASGWAGAPGVAFARVLVGADRARMVPHFLAVDVASDNRLKPGARWTSRHVFAARCNDPEVRAWLVHRAWPLALARERGWPLVESLMAEVRR